MDDVAAWLQYCFLDKLDKLLSFVHLDGIYHHEWVLYALGLAVVWLALLIFGLANNMRCAGSDIVCVVVLGDTGRSPRMQNHALSFANAGFSVDFIGYGGSLPHEDFRSNTNIEEHVMVEPPIFFRNFPRIICYVLKVLWQSVILLITFLRTRKSSHILIQNPPCIPTLAVACVFSWYRDSMLVVDWHNYGYTILGLSLGNSHPLVRFSKWYEKWFGLCSTKNICVTNGMKEDLEKNWKIRAVTMYDRPPEKFKDVDVDESHSLFAKLSVDYDVFRSSDESSTDETQFTEEAGEGNYQLKANRPALLISCTSWTEDEDFSVLLRALEKYEISCNSSTGPPKLVCVITGKGPLKEYYQSVIAKKKFKNVRFCTPWLRAEDYPVLLGSADLGVCLHKSSSGLDLPMKVVDMFGCRLPVCAIKFKCIDELVRHNENGLVFKDENELSKQLQDLLANFPEETTTLNLFRKNLKTFQETRWEDTWRNTVLPLFK